MSMKLKLDAVLSYFANNQRLAEVNGNTVGECLDNLIRQYPDLKRVMYTTDGKLASFIDVYINGENAYPRGVSKPVEDGDDLGIVLMGG